MQPTRRRKEGSKNVDAKAPESRDCVEGGKKVEFNGWRFSSSWNGLVLVLDRPQVSAGSSLHSFKGILSALDNAARRIFHYFYMLWYGITGRTWRRTKWQNGLDDRGIDRGLDGARRRRAGRWVMAGSTHQCVGARIGTRHTSSIHIYICVYFFLPEAQSGRGGGA